MITNTRLAGREILFATVTYREYYEDLQEIYKSFPFDLLVADSIF